MSPLRVVGIAAALAAVCAVPVDADAPMTAVEAIRFAIQERMGGNVEVTVAAIDGLAGEGPFAEATPSPAGRLGRPVRFTLDPIEGPSVHVSVAMTVVADHVVATGRLGRGATVEAADVAVLRAELTGVPIREIPTARDVIGGRVLRPIEAGAVVLPGSVALRRSVEPGDRVTVVAISGPVEVSATFIASDGGRPGDVIRVMNPSSRRYIRGRIVRDGILEVFHES